MFHVVVVKQVGEHGDINQNAMEKKYCRHDSITIQLMGVYCQ